MLEVLHYIRIHVPVSTQNLMSFYFQYAFYSRTCEAQFGYHCIVNLKKI